MLEVILNILSSLVMLWCLCYCAAAIVKSIIPEQSLVLRVTSVSLVGLWLLMVIFNLLIQLNLFTQTAAYITFLSLVLIVRFTSGVGLIYFYDHCLDQVNKHLVIIKSLTLNLKLLAAGLFFIIAAVAVRSFLLLPISWDTLTYHAFKSGLWIQGKGLIGLEMPGPWAFYKYYLGGGEALHAWVLLLQNNDSYMATFDFLFWLALAVVIYGLARELGGGRLLSVAITGYLSTLHCIYLSAGSLNTELSLYLCLYGAILCILNFFKEKKIGYLVISSMGLGVMASIKITGLLYLGVVAIFLAIFLMLSLRSFISFSKAALLMSFFLMLAFGPWLLLNYQEAGYLLGSAPLKVAGVSLGKTIPEMQWTMARPELKPYTLAAELHALKATFHYPFTLHPHLSILSLPLFFLAAYGFVDVVLKRKWKYLIIILVGVAAFYCVYQPSFSTVRILVAELNGRFLWPAACMVVFLACAGGREGRSSKCLIFYLLVGMCLNVVPQLFFGLDHSFLDFIIVSYTIIIAGSLVLIYGAPFSQRWIGLLAGIGLGIILIIGHVYKNQRRHEILEKTTSLQDVHRYWIPASKEVDSPGREPYNIALLAGPNQDNDQFFSYHFLGRSLQNKIFYVPSSKDGEIISHSSLDRHAELRDFNLWVQRLAEKEIDYVMAFKPWSTELYWMVANTKYFEFIVGDKGSWGLFRLK